MRVFFALLGSGVVLTSAGELLAGAETLFVPNVGQCGETVLYGTFPKAVLFERDRVIVEGVGITFVQANKPEVNPLHRADARFNYYVGKDPARWRVGIPSYSSLSYGNMYEGIDLTFVGTEGGVELHWTVRPGGDPMDIRIRLSGGETSIEDGEVVVRRKGKAILRLSKPEAYQGAEKVRVSYALEGDTLTFVLDDYDRKRALVIDPYLNTLTSSTFLGGSSSESARDVFATAGAVYVVGNTSSSDFPGSGGLTGSSDVFVAKFSRDLNTLIAATFFGGGDYEEAYAVGVLGGNVMVGGFTRSSDLPTPSGAFTSYSGNGDGFVAQFDTNLTLLSSTYLGGSQYDDVRGLDVGGTLTYIVGKTSSPDFPVSGGYDLSHNGGYDVFVAKLFSLSSPPVATFLGGSGDDWGFAVKYSPSSVSVVGWTSSPDYPTVAAYDNTLGGPRDAFVSLLTVDLSSLGASTYVGGSGDDRAYALDDIFGEKVVVGWTNSTDFPVVGNSTTLSGVGDAFIFHLFGTSLTYSAYLGGTGNDVAGGVLYDGNDGIFVIGHTSSSDFPVSSGAYDNTFGGLVDAFVVRYDTTTSSIVEATYLGGTNDDEAYSVSIIDSSLYVVGGTASPNFPTNAYDNTLGGTSDAFLSLFSPSLATHVEERENRENRLEVEGNGITVRLTVASYVGITVQAGDGRVVGSLSKGFLPKGTYRFALPSLPRGIYLLTVRVGKRIINRRIVL